MSILRIENISKYDRYQKDEFKKENIWKFETAVTMKSFIFIYVAITFTLFRCKQISL